MKLLKSLSSKTDNVTKYVFKLDDGLITEFSYINKGDGKDIICVPTQTSCKMKCQFCHITSITDQLIHRNLTYIEITSGVDNVIKLSQSCNTTLLISYMGLGEPALNLDNVLMSMRTLKLWNLIGRVIRFAISTSVPKQSSSKLIQFLDSVIRYELDVKFHVSVHFLSKKIRSQVMPGTSLDELIDFVKRFSEFDYNRSLEFHYCIISGVNDTRGDADALRGLVKLNSGSSVKLLEYNEVDNLNFSSSESATKTFAVKLLNLHVKSEIYTPPGIDIGASCGQFLKQDYLKFNSKSISTEVTV